MPDGIQQLGTQLAEALAPKRSDLVTVSYGTVKAVNETEADVRLDVDLHGGTLYGLPMTTACRGVAVGDRVIVQTYGHLSTVTGVIAHDNPHYVNEGLGSNLHLSVCGKMAIVTADFLNVSRASAIQTVGNLPDWCKPLPCTADPNDSGMWIDYLAVRGAQSYGQLMVNTDGSIEAYSSLAGGYHFGQVAFLIE